MNVFTHHRYAHFTVFASLLFVACAVFAHAATDAQAYVAEENEDCLAAKYAPVFLVQDASKDYNRVATPVALEADRAKDEISMDPSHPTIYWQETHFETPKGHYTNLFYRVHFERSPFTWKPFNASAGRNVGIMAIVTLDSDYHPILVTTVHTCGCYHAIVPTSFLSKDDYPPGWDAGGITVYGEHLPSILYLAEPYSPDVKPVIHVRSGTHRVMDVTVATLDDLPSQGTVVKTPLAPMEDLKHLPLGDLETSLYFTDGPKRGLVKGAHKPWETVLFGWWVGDLHVGQDREYGSKKDSGRLFYTTLNPFKKHRTDMSNYAGFLDLNGWHL